MQDLNNCPAISVFAFVVSVFSLVVSSLLFIVSFHQFKIQRETFSLAIFLKSLDHMGTNEARKARQDKAGQNGGSLKVDLENASAEYQACLKSV
jgi:hypothetical protein